MTRPAAHACVIQDVEWDPKLETLLATHADIAIAKKRNLVGGGSTLDIVLLTLTPGALAILGKVLLEYARSFRKVSFKSNEVEIKNVTSSELLDILKATSKPPSDEVSDTSLGKPLGTEGRVRSGPKVPASSRRTTPEKL